MAVAHATAGAHAQDRGGPMRALLAIALLLPACASAPRRALVAKVAHVAVAGSSMETGQPETDPGTISLAQDYLNVAAVSLWAGLNPSQALANTAIGDALEGALPPNTTRQWRVKLLTEAQASLSPPPPPRAAPCPHPSP